MLVCKEIGRVSFADPHVQTNLFSKTLAIYRTHKSRGVSIAEPHVHTNLISKKHAFYGTRTKNQTNMTAGGEHCSPHICIQKDLAKHL